MELEAATTRTAREAPRLHHAARDVPVTPQGLDSFVVVTGARSLVEEWAPSILVLCKLPSRRHRGHVVQKEQR